jgi:hypothetical protein
LRVLLEGSWQGNALGRFNIVLGNNRFLSPQPPSPCDMMVYEIVTENMTEYYYQFME